jgi:Calpain family cysteine protease
MGDCYLLSAMAALCEQPSLIARLFDTDVINPAGCYSIWINVNGLWK